MLRQIGRGVRIFGNSRIRHASRPIPIGKIWRRFAGLFFPSCPTLVLAFGLEIS
jgi:hypothetical protein